MEIEVGEEVEEALTEEATAVRAEQVGDKVGQETGTVPSQSVVTPTLPGGPSVTSARILRRSALQVEKEAAAAEVTEVVMTEEEVEDSVEVATEMTEEEAEGASEETEGEEEEEVTEVVMTEEGAAEDLEAAEIEMIGEEEALEAEGAVVTVVAGALGAETDAAEAEDLAEIGVAAGGPWEEGGEGVTGTGLTRHRPHIMRGNADQTVDIYSDHILIISRTKII